MNPSPHFERVAVLGLGLLGGSLALATRTRGLARCVVGSARRSGPLEWALENGIVDEIASIEAAVVGADLVVLATPISSMPGVLQMAAPNLEQGAIVTDLGSVKGALADCLPGLLPPGVSYIGSHPMAGSHLSGVEHARADLFDGACSVVTPSSGSDSEALGQLTAFWEALGARVEVRDPVAHDLEAAWVSHAPHLIAFAFGHALASAPEAARSIAGSGFRDFTRIARSDSGLWGDILSANRKALLGPLQEFGRSLENFIRAVEDGDQGALEQYLVTSREVLADMDPASDEVDGGLPGGESERG